MIYKDHHNALSKVSILFYFMLIILSCLAISIQTQYIPQIQEETVHNNNYNDNSNGLRSFSFNSNLLIQKFKQSFVFSEDSTEVLMKELDKSSTGDNKPPRHNNTDLTDDSEISDGHIFLIIFFPVLVITILVTFLLHHKQWACFSAIDLAEHHQSYRQLNPHLN
jgi:hypothetical protein